MRIKTNNMNPNHIDAIIHEINKAKSKHPIWPKDNVKRAAIVTGEAGEALKEAIKLDEGIGSIENLRTEIIQMIGTGFRFLEELDKDDCLVVKLKELDKDNLK